MGQCGCGDSVEDKLLLLPNGWVVAHGTYRGCQECHPGPGYGIKIYDTLEHAQEWLDVEPERVSPCQFGGNDGGGWGGEICEVEDIVSAVKSIERDGCEVGEDAAYASVADFMEDFGLTIMQEAMRRCEGRRAKASKPSAPDAEKACECPRPIGQPATYRDANGVVRCELCNRKPSAPAKEGE